MKKSNGRWLFGFWDGMPYRTVTDKYEDFVRYKNSIDKQRVIAHIETLDDWLASEMSTDLFSGEMFHSGVYMDGDFTFSVDFFRYYKTREIGIPYEYEAYLKTILK